MDEGEERTGRTCTRRKLRKRKGSLILGSPFTGRDPVWTAKEFQRLRGGKTASVWQAGQRERPAGSPGHLTASPTQVTHLLLHMGAEVQKLRLQQTDWREDWGLQPADTRMWSGPQFGVQRTELESAIERTRSHTCEERGRVPTISASRSVCSRGHSSAASHSGSTRAQQAAHTWRRG